MHTRSRRVSRCLFGKPDHEELEKWLTKELEAIQIEREKGYGFDFKNDQPFPSTAYIVEAVPENEVPFFYRTTYYPSKEHSKKRTVDFTEQKLEGNGDVVAYHTRSRNAAAAKLNITVPKVSKGGVKVIAQSRDTKVQRPALLKTRSVRKISRKSVLRKKSMKQSLLTNYLPVVKKRRSLTRSECSETSKLPDDIHVEMDCLGTKVLNSSSSGVKTRWQSRRCEDPSSRSLRSAF
ncbi:unnamed protein product [Cercopithifilaria johnstoni]|uniref:Cyclin-dependent kinase inhibitor domain-containing protein n=1 Tax=Cercopithifilaria johnstoni TaxID=2874296 RepID=A0A8J2M421_9BILA|nr:unnamed protein product [Cercopithifilaria johnstoni]